MSTFSLLLTCVGCIEIPWQKIAALFLSARWKTKLRPDTPLVSRLRYAAFLEMQIRSQYLRPGNYRPFMAIQGNTITRDIYSRGTRLHTRARPKQSGTGGVTQSILHPTNNKHTHPSLGTYKVRIDRDRYVRLVIVYVYIYVCRWDEGRRGFL